jgi:phosphomannomutase
VGGLAIPAILRALGVKNIIELNCEPTGHFAHNPEPLPQNLTEISDLMREGKADVGFVVDPDVDRLAIICENGDMFGEEYTLVSVADYVLSKTPGNTVSNMSSTRALSDVTVKHGGSYSASAVGEVNVTTEMKRTNAVIGGEGNGGVIYPASHYGRDALVGIALFLSSLAQKGCKVSELRATFPEYCISKNRIDLTPEIDVDKVLEAVKEKYAGERINDKDGVKIDFADGWVHLRKSNTEPIIRVYSEAATMEEADALAKKVIDVVWEVVG